MSGAGSDFTTALPIVKHDDPIEGATCSLEKSSISTKIRNDRGSAATLVLNSPETNVGKYEKARRVQSVKPLNAVASGLTG